MNKKLEDITLRSERVQEVLTKAPHWLIRFGNLILLSFSLLLLFLSWLIKYPDVVESAASLNWQNPPVMVQSEKVQELSQLLVKPGEQVVQGQHLATLNSTANYNQVMALKGLIEETDFQNNEASFPLARTLGWSLGTLFSDYDEFAEAYIRFKENGSIRSSANLAQLQPYRQLLASQNRLKQQIMAWEASHLLKAPAAGLLHFETTLTKGQSLETNQKLFSIKGNGDTEMVISMKVSGAQLYKLAEGQSVNLSLERYPVSEFGKFQAYISFIAMKPDAHGFFAVRAKVPESGWVVKGTPLRTEAGMKGAAEIITADHRLSDRLFQKVKNMFGPS